MTDLNIKVPALEKLVDYVASGVGAIGGPMLARWKARTQAAAARIEAQGQAEALRIEAQAHIETTKLIAEAQTEARRIVAADDSSFRGEVSIAKAIESRLEFQERKRESNIQSVVGKAAEALDGKHVDRHEVDHDWVARFFADAQDVTSEDMQAIWAKILAGEVETPGRTSLHTLAVLKNMSRRDAELFESVTQFVFLDFIPYGGRELAERLNAIPEYPSFDNIIRLGSYELLKQGPLRERLQMISGQHATRIKDVMYVISTGSGVNELMFRAHVLTPQGKELNNLIGREINYEYLREIARYAKDNGNFKIERARILENLGDQLMHGPLVVVQPSDSPKN